MSFYFLQFILTGLWLMLTLESYSTYQRAVEAGKKKLRYGMVAFVAFCGSMFIQELIELMLTVAN